MAKLTNEEFIKIQEENSEMFQEHYDKIKKLPENTFAGLAVDKVVKVKISGMFLQYLRVQMDYLMQSEEPYTVIASLMKVKDKILNNGKDKNNKKIEYTNYDIAFYCCYVLLHEIGAESEKGGLSTVYDKEDIIKEVDRQFMKDAPISDIEPLTAEELASRMGITVSKSGKVVFDEDYIKKRGMDKARTTNDDIETHFGAPPEEILKQGIDPVKPYKDRKENRQEYYDKG